MPRPARLLATAALVGLVLEGVVVPMTSAALSGAAPVGSRSVVASSSSSGSSSLVAGYRARLSDVDRASGSFVVPTFSCTGEQNLSIRIQLGKENPDAAGLVLVGCDASGAAPVLLTLACAGDTGRCGGTPIPVSPGDTIQVTLSVTPKVSRASLENLANGLVQSASGAGATPPGAMSLVLGRSSATVPTFTHLAFKRCSVDGEALGDASPRPIDMTSSGTKQVKAGPLTPSGRGFSLEFEHS